MPVIDDRNWWLKKAKQAEENAAWNVDRANRAYRDHAMTAYKDHMHAAEQCRKEAKEYRYLAARCTK